MAIEEINGRFKCSECGREWSGMAGDDEIPDTCDCTASNDDVTWLIPARETRVVVYAVEAPDPESALRAYAECGEGDEWSADVCEVERIGEPTTDTDDVLRLAGADREKPGNPEFIREAIRAEWEKATASLASCREQLQRAQGDDRKVEEWDCMTAGAEERCLLIVRLAGAVGVSLAVPEDPHAPQEVGDDFDADPAAYDAKNALMKPQGDPLHD